MATNDMKMQCGAENGQGKRYNGVQRRRKRKKMACFLNGFFNHYHFFQFTTQSMFIQAGKLNFRFSRTDYNGGKTLGLRHRIIL